ncbi:MAG: ABC transporter ATP-binding protein, partial [Lentisphaerae bacterium]|nr:ABC transporter ATP-binding protein [Lentisphaerota bacterium]
GETYALVGESGCGKSVTALSILQLVDRPAGYIAGGMIYFHDQNLAALPPAKMRDIRGNGISMIFQEPMTALNPVYTVGDQVSEVMRLHMRMKPRDANGHAIEMLKKVGIPDAARRFNEYPHQMSGGMRQRVMIAMALACKPDLLIADEPTTALDVTIQSQIMELIAELQSETGTAVLLITHDMGVVRENADRIGIMYAGRIVEEGRNEDVFSSPAHPYTELLLNSLPSRGEHGKRLVTIAGMVPKAVNFPEGCRFADRCPFVMGCCRLKIPERLSVGNGHVAECVLLNPAIKKPSPIRSSSEPTDANPIAADNSISLRVDGLKMYFPIRSKILRRTVANVKAVDNTNFIIKPGETLALVGESGCGKTTVGKCIVRLLDPTGGSVQYRGMELTNAPNRRLKELRSKIQMIFQDPFSSLNPRLMIGKAIIEGMQVHGIGSHIVDRFDRLGTILEKVGLSPDMADRYPHEFSGGQRQRIGLARALAVEPELVICDEATSSLDVSVQAQILNLLKDLQNELGLSYLFITHDLGVVKYLADRVSVMYLGRIVEEGTNDEILNNARHPYTQALLSAIPRTDKKTGRERIVLPGDVPSPINPPSGCHFHPRCPKALPKCASEYPVSVSFSETHRCACRLYY